MGSKLNPVLVVLTLTASFPLVESIGDRSLYLRESLNGTSSSSVADTIDIKSIIGTLETENSVHLELLYDDHYAEVIFDLSTNLSSNIRGIRVYRLEEKAKTLLQIINMSKRERFHLLVICSMENIVSIFQTIKEKRLESHFIQWIIVSFSGEESRGLMLQLEGLLYEGTRVIIVSKLLGKKFYFFASHTDVHGLPRFHFKGGWVPGSNKGRDLLPHLANQEAEASPNMRGRRMTITAVAVYPFIQFKKTFPDGTVEPESFGTDVLLVESLSQALNFTYQIVPSPDGTWGAPQADGRITGVVGMVARREASFAIGGNVMNEAREEVIDYTTWYSQGYLKIFSGAPGEKNRALAVLFTFGFEVWLCIIFSVIGVGTFSILQVKLLQMFQGNDLKMDFQDYYFTIFRSLVNQCNLMKVTELSQRIVLFSWYVFCLIVTALYSGMLTAVLAVPEFETPVDSLTHLSRAVQRGFTLGVTRESSNEYVFRDATEGIYKEVWGLFNHEDRSKSFVPSPMIGMKKILEDKFIFIWFEMLGKNVAAGLGRYKFHISRESFFPQSFAFPIPQGAPYKESFSRVIMRIIEGGIMEKWQDDAFRRNSKPDSVEDGNFSAITLKHLQAAFILLMLGFLTSLAVLTLEKMAVSCGY